MEKHFTQALDELSSIRDLIRFCVSRFYESDLFFGHSTESEWDEAVALVLHSLSLPNEIDKSVLDAKLTSTEREKILQLASRRINERMPLPYLTNVSWFCDLPFYVDERVLIPRSPFAELIQSQFAPWLTEDKQPANLLDLCTGSACIAIALAHYFPDAQVDASDLSEDALSVAKQNVEHYRLEQQVSLFHSDLFTALPKETSYDIIVSNPPYVAEESMQQLPKEYQHEPRQALFAAQDGLAIVITILQQAADHLTDDGLLIVEVGEAEQSLQKRFPQIPFVWLEFEHGGEGVFLLTSQQLREYRDQLV